MKSGAVRSEGDPVDARPVEPISAGTIVAGVLFAGLIVLLSRYLDIGKSVAYVGASAPAPAPLYLLFLWLLVAAPLARRFGGRLRVSRRQALAVYAIVVAAGTIPSHQVVGFMLPHMASVHYNATPENDWIPLFHQHLARWMFPPREASLAFATGENLPVPWGAWIVPLVAWSFLLLVLFFVMLCVANLVSRQWIRHERLSFPLVAIPIELTTWSRPNDRFPDLLRKPLFWFGVGIPLFFATLGFLHSLFPNVPAARLRGITLWEQPLKAPWSGLGRWEWNFMFWLIGVAFIVPTDISMSAWVFFFVTRLENVAAVLWTGASGPPSVYSPLFPALFYQGMGALVGLFVIALWTGRGHWRRALRAAIGREPDASLRFSVIGAGIGLFVLALWTIAAGMRPSTALAFWALFVTIMIGLARVRVETGLGIIMSPLIVSEALYTVRGTAAFHPVELTAIASLRWTYFARGTMGVLPAQLEGFKVAESLRIDRRRLAIGMYLAIVVSLLLAIYATLTLYYEQGFEQMRIGDRTRHYIGSQSYWAYQNLVSYLLNPSPPSIGGSLAIGVGFVASLLLAALRYRFLWWPFHPVGFLAANSWGMHIYWSAFFMGWLAKTTLLRTGGIGSYRRAMPFFTGLILGDMLNQGIFGVLRAIVFPG